MISARADWIARLSTLSWEVNEVSLLAQCDSRTAASRNATEMIASEIDLPRATR